ncbi:MFS transporter [Shimwellia blattae]|uniref:Putative sugar phosphate permease n=1 Tax=Shimwellia blattae (strain ATCC 29907 / DSM 4481 / JCM 1650 / NBRC 105725 / CDC 9005-74) TaxID=630626 RepID=I2B836_SHIBC|nr:MFS transporter [Shimwellia blattae]AFJ46690.1 putative sugar phosphate permease [Shimwellia blattae DSM 4481 = NBRC 105725]GAB80268.1 putative galactarate transporter [Shimwellia blattae DSM 4481 = NBRC 105725]VDY64166.1 D-galactarate permease [Shimwellia blattae]VEC22294.1 D-galactarate permease [Shimwellia blattae]
MSNHKESYVSLPRSTHVGRRRYWVLALIFIITVINYADRATMSIAGTSVIRELSLDPMMLGMIFSAFAWAYALGQIPGGWLLDKFGARRVYGISLILWSLFTALQGTVGWMGLSGVLAASTLFLMRFMLGLVESPAFPANSRIVSCWFPTRERGLASALFNSGQYMAVVLFTPLMAWITHAWGWEHIFLWMGALGLVLAAVWFIYYRDPHQDPRLSPQEKALMKEGGALVDLDACRQEKKPGLRLAEMKCLFVSRSLWAIYLGQYCITALTYFFITWFPVYLIQGRGMSLMQAGWVAALPAICGFTGGLLGGYLSDMLIARGVHPSRARKTPFIIGMGLSTTLVFANVVESDSAVIFLMAMAFFGKGFAAIGWAVISDVAPKNMVGLCGGVFNCIGNIAGIITPMVIGYVVSVTGSFNLALYFVAAHGLLAIISYGLIAGRFERIPGSSPECLSDPVSSHQ